MDHKPVIDACGRLYARDMRSRDIIVFATVQWFSAVKKVKKGDCDATD
jgi:hypothetical protein